MGMLGEPGPDLLEREQALRPGAQQQRAGVAGLALGVPDVQPVDRPEAGFDRERHG
jgi:hypothetical protein